MKTIMVCGYGPGISEAVARRFGAAGFAVALVARKQDKLAAGVEALRARGVTAHGFVADLGDAEAVPSLVAKVGAALGPVTVIHWNAYTVGAGDLTTAPLAELRSTVESSVTGLVAAVQAALPDLRRQEGAAVLVTGGGFSSYDPNVDAMIVQWNAMGLAVAKAAQHKLTGLLRAKLAADGIYVGEVVVLGAVKGTPFDFGNATITGDAVAERFWRLYHERQEASAAVS